MCRDSGSRAQVGFASSGIPIVVLKAGASRAVHCRNSESAHRGQDPPQELTDRRVPDMLRVTIHNSRQQRQLSHSAGPLEFGRVMQGRTSAW